MSRGLWASALGGFLFGPASTIALTNIYFTRFEASEGYDTRYELVGQKGWVCDTESFGGNGLTNNILATQAAYIGYDPLDPLDDLISVWQPLDFDPLARGMPLIEFSVLMTVMDSTTTNRDDFLWTVYNSEGSPLLSVDFYNEGLGVWYGLNTNDLEYTGVDFTNDVPYDLKIRMDFGRNRWSATLSGRLLLTNQPIAASWQKLDLADVDAVWWPLNPARPGDNFMVFDDYKVAADAPMPARLMGLGRDSTGQFLLRLFGPPGSRYAIDASTNFLQWTSLKTNVVTDGYFDFIDTGARTLPRRFYRGRHVP